MICGEGGGHRAGNRIRITTQLIETKNGAHIWAQRFDGSLDENFELQDNITKQVAGALQPSIQLAEIERTGRKRPQEFGAYDFTMQALPYCWHLEQIPTRLNHLTDFSGLLARHATCRGLDDHKCGVTTSSGPENSAFGGSNQPIGVVDELARCPTSYCAHRLAEWADLAPSNDSIWSELALERTETEFALDYLERALQVDPNYTLALALAAWCHAQRPVYSWTDTRSVASKLAASLIWAYQPHLSGPS